MALEDKSPILVPALNVCIALLETRYNNQYSTIAVPEDTERQAEERKVQIDLIEK